MTMMLMLVGLKVPDNVAITAFNTLKRMKFYQLKGLERANYYKFDVRGNVDDFRKKISNVDILVNTNKNKFSFSIEGNKEGKNNYKNINILIQDNDNRGGLLSTLRERLGFDEIKKLESGILWTMSFEKGIDAKKIALEITKSLLMNDNYQKYKII